MKAGVAGEDDPGLRPKHLISMLSAARVCVLGQVSPLPRPQCFLQTPIPHNLLRRMGQPGAAAGSEPAGSPFSPSHFAFCIRALVFVGTLWASGTCSPVTSLGAPEEILSKSDCEGQIKVCRAASPGLQSQIPLVGCVSVDRQPCPSVPESSNLDREGNGSCTFRAGRWGHQTSKT